MLEYVNILTFFVFIGTFAFFVYEIRSFIKDYKKERIKLPAFSEKDLQRQKLQTATPLKITPPKAKRINYSLAFVGFIGVMALFGFSFLTLNSVQRSSAKEDFKPIIKPLRTNGIEIFDSNWNKFSEEDLNKLKPGDKIFIGIDNPDPQDIDKARIRVNEYVWKDSHETREYNKDNNVFYIEYSIPTDEAKLIIEAQLHSKTNGWLTE